MISANGGLPAHRYTPQVTHRWPRGSEPASPPVMPQGNLVEVLGREVRQGSPGELMVESTLSR